MQVFERVHLAAPDPEVVERLGYLSPLPPLVDLVSAGTVVLSSAVVADESVAGICAGAMSPEDVTNECRGAPELAAVAHERAQLFDHGLGSFGGARGELSVPGGRTEAVVELSLHLALSIEVPALQPDHDDVRIEQRLDDIERPQLERER